MNTMIILRFPKIKMFDLKVFTRSSKLLNRWNCHHLLHKHFSILNHLKNDFGQYEKIQKVSSVFPSAPVPNYILKPEYAESGIPRRGPLVPEVKGAECVKGMKESSKIAAATLNHVAKCIQEGMTTEDIDVIVRKFVIENNAYPSTLNYKGYPKSCCTSVNNIACHGIPDSRPIHNGDIISVDVTVFKEGFHGDCCDTYIIGDVDVKGKHLVQTAKKCRDSAIQICGPGVLFSAIGELIEETASSENLTVVPAFTGHGIGTYFHGAPDVYHFRNKYPGVMKPGMTFTIEPIIAQGDENVVILEDSWTAAMEDCGRAAQFEHTILITENGVEILTER